MNEVEKMYENAIGKVCTHTIINPERCNKRRMTRCCGCDYYAYPPFTPEKQLELVKWCCKKCRRFYIYNINDIDNFSENLAKEFNHYWQDLTEQERTEIADILKG